MYYAYIKTALQLELPITYGKREADSSDCMWALAGVFPKRNKKRRKPQWTSPSFPLLPPPQITVKRPVLAKAALPGGFFLQITPFLNSDKTHNSKSICIWYIRIQGHPSQTLTSKRECKGSKAPLSHRTELLLSTSTSWIQTSSQAPCVKCI